MGTGKVLLNFGKAILNRAGIMTERQMLAATTKAGRYARDILATGGTLTDDLAGSIFKRVLPKGVKAPDFVTTSADAAADWIGEKSTLPKELITESLNRIGGFNTISPKTSESLIFYNPKFEVNENIFSHEFRHHLDNVATIRSKLKGKISKLLMKFPGVQRNSKKISLIAQSKYDGLEQLVIAKGGLEKVHILENMPFEPTKAGLLQRMGVTEEEFSGYLSAKVNNLLNGQKPKDKIKLLKSFIFAMQTETNAQRAGAKLSRAIGHLKPNESCRSDMSAIFHEEILKILQAELKTQRKNYYKSFLGCKVPKEKYQKEILHSKVGIITPADIKESMQALNVDNLLKNHKVTKITQYALNDDGEVIATEIVDELKKTS